MTNMLKPLRRFLCKRTLSPKALGLATLGRQRHACDLSCALPMEEISPYASDDGGGTNAALFQAYIFFYITAVRVEQRQTHLVIRISVTTPSWHISRTGVSAARLLPNL